MKIQIIGSMKFAREMMQLQKDLGKLGHQAKVPIGTDAHLVDSSFVENLEDNLKWCIENDIMRKNFMQIEDVDGVLVVNHTRNNIEGFIGISALMEVGIAHYLDKKIFLLNDCPSFNEHRWAQEVAIMQPVVLHGDLKKIV